MFDTAISGLQAATTDLSVIGNNVANAGSTGFKSSRAQFADVYAANSSASKAVGLGAKVASVDQIFTQGSLNITNNTLDLAIDDKGFFGLQDRGTMVYTRAGAFTTDSNGYIVNKSGQRLIGYQADGVGGVSGQSGALRIDTSIASPTATSAVSLKAHLNSNGKSVDPVANPWPAEPFAFNSKPPAAGTYTHTTSVTVYDELGNAHDLSLYFALQQNPDGSSSNVWNVYTLIDGVTVENTKSDGTAIPAGEPAATLAFDGVGQIIPASSSTMIGIVGWEPLSPLGQSNGAASQNLTVSLDGAESVFQSFSVDNVVQDGTAAGQLNRIAVDESGVINGYYSNNETKALGQVALYNFANVQGLKPLGDTSWGETPDSGVPQIGAPGTGSLGSIQAGALEQSNVDVTGELVHLILAQRNYQANAQVIAADDKVTQTILNIR
jgi:flagellar hook protein FlgE